MSGKESQEKMLMVCSPSRSCHCEQLKGTMEWATIYGDDDDSGLPIGIAFDKEMRYLCRVDDGTGKIEIVAVCKTPEITAELGRMIEFAHVNHLPQSLQHRLVERTDSVWPTKPEDKPTIPYDGTIN